MLKSYEIIMILAFFMESSWTKGINCDIKLFNMTCCTKKYYHELGNFHKEVKFYFSKYLFKAI